MTAASESGDGASRPRRSTGDNRRGAKGQRRTSTSRRLAQRGYASDRPQDLGSPGAIITASPQLLRTDGVLHMRGRGSRQNLEGWLRHKTAPAPPRPKPTRPPRRPPPTKPPAPPQPR